MIDKAHLQNLAKIVTDENILADKAHLLSYSYDATRLEYEPDCVIFPRDESDVSKVLKYCNEQKIVIIPRGAGSGFSGGSLPQNGGIVLSLEKHMNKIIEIDMQNLVAVVQPGVINAQFQKAVEEVGLFYPPDPASMDFSTLGGNVAENAGGMKATKYGITKDFVMALRAVLPNGDIIRAGKKTIKDVAGYNISGILVASEGTLAVITELTLRLLPKPKYKQTLMGIFPSVEDAMNATYKTFAKGVMPVAMEFLDNLTINAIEQVYKIGLPKDAGAVLISDVDGNTKEDISFQTQSLESIFRQNRALFIKVAQNEDEARQIWFARKNASQSLKVYGNKKLNEDITVPRSALPKLLKKIEEIGTEFEHKIPCFGHTGDGNVHVNVMTDKNDSAKYLKAEQAITEVFKAAIALGGTLSGEHGIGLSKASFMDIAFSKEEMNLFRAIKKAFDPNNILNPNKMGL